MSVDTSVESYRGRVTRVMSRCCRRRRRHRRRRIHLKNAKLKSFATKKLFILEKKHSFPSFFKNLPRELFKTRHVFQKKEGRSWFALFAKVFAILFLAKFVILLSFFLFLPCVNESPVSWRLLEMNLSIGPVVNRSHARGHWKTLQRADKVKL